MLNALHLVQYQDYFRARLRHLAPSATDTAGNHTNGHTPATGVDSSGSISAMLEAMGGLAGAVGRSVSLPRKPRMLVVAPSNAAVDELLSRVLSRGFLDGEMRSYRPAVARVGADPTSPAAMVSAAGTVPVGLMTLHCRA